MLWLSRLLNESEVQRSVLHSCHFRRVAYDVMIALIGNTLLHAGRSIALSIVIWASWLLNNEIASEPMD